MMVKHFSAIHTPQLGLQPTASTFVENTVVINIPSSGNMTQ